MKTKILLAGKNSIVMDDFFYNMSDRLECQSTSTRIEDINCHVKYFKPDFYIYCLWDESEEMHERISDVFGRLEKRGVLSGIIGDHDKCEGFLGRAKTAPKLVLERPLTAALIVKKIEAVCKEEKENRFEAVAAEESFLGDGELESGAKKAEEKPSRRHVTVIDDDFRMLRVLKEYLHGEYDVATAVNGKTALKFLESKSTDIILLDYVMPDEDGPAVYEKIRAIPAYADTPIVFLTGMSEREKIHKVMELHPQGYLLKPIERERLLSTIESLIH